MTNTISEMSEQEQIQHLFNIISRHLLIQNVQSRDNTGACCKYRNSDGLKCAIGCLILDSEYDKNMEGSDIFYLYKNFPNISLFTTYKMSIRILEFLNDMQHGHDINSNWVNMPYSMVNFFNTVIKKYNLKTPEIVEWVNMMNKDYKDEGD